MMSSSTDNNNNNNNKGKLLILGGTGFLGQTVGRRAVLEGYAVTSLSRRGLPATSSEAASTLALEKVDYRQGDARQPSTVAAILQEGGYVGIVHAIGLLLDEQSGLGAYNRFLSGSGSLPDAESTYDTITRQTAFYAIDAATEYAKQQGIQGFPFIFTSAAEAGWPQVAGGQFLDAVAPDFLKRYLVAKRAVEAKLLDAAPTLRPVIVRPSLIYSMDRPASFLPVGAFFVGNRLGLPFVDRPVTVQALASAMVAALSRDDVEGILRYPEIDQLSQSS